jgi:site-specific DNA-methyltransferase (adenine-specific)
MIPIFDKVMQQSLFETNPVELVSIDEAAATARVSSATIRNWVKTGYLPLEKKGHIDRQALTVFLDGRSGATKLTTRANKSQKDRHDHPQLSSAFIEKIIDPNANLTQLSEDYQTSLSESFRNKEGVYYTPADIVSDLFKIHAQSAQDATFLDPCCGSGNFIIRALELGFLPENVYGYDTDPIAIEITRKRILKLTGQESENIRQIDFLEDSTEISVKVFDYIYTNPPWGKKLENRKRNALAKLFDAGTSIDTCSLFMFASLRRLAPGGELGLLLPDSFFNIATFEAARARVLSLQVKVFIDYGRPFKGLLSKAFAFVLKNETGDVNNSMVECRPKSGIFTKRLNSFCRNPKSIINFQTRPEHDLVMQHLFQRPHVFLSGKDKWALGIVTGNNEKFIKSAHAEGLFPVIRGSDISAKGLLEATCYITSDFSQYQQVAPLNLYQAPIKLIYKFISSTLCFYCDREQRFILNSANMVIPNKDFPIAPEQLASLFNSEIINWLFLNLFRTHKILRADLESIPVHAEYFEHHSTFDEEKYLDYLSIEKDGHGAYRIKG